MQRDEEPPGAGSDAGPQDRLDVARAVLASTTGVAVCDLHGLVLEAGGSLLAQLAVDPHGRKLGELLSTPGSVEEPLPVDRLVEDLLAGAEHVLTGALVRRPDGQVQHCTVLMTLGDSGDAGHVVLVHVMSSGSGPWGTRPGPGRDALTGLRDRAGAVADLAARLDAGRTGDRARLGVIACDLDRFRVVNDSLGVEVGDQVLTTAAERLALGLRGGDLLARVGDDEFLVVLAGLTDEAEAVDVAHRITRSLAAPVRVDGPTGPQDVRCSASTGLVLVDLPGAGGAVGDVVDAGAVLRDVHTALDAAKAAGGSSCCVFTDALRARADRRLTVENDLRRALEEGELRVHYQPVVDLRDGHRTGFEALVRWAHPRRGLLLPEQFLDVAEDSGLLGAVDGLVLEEALGFLARHPGACVNVNTSGRRLDGTFAPTVARGLSRRGLAPDRLTVELLEGSLVPGDSITEAELRDLAALGVGVLIDDFGTGYSTLSYLRRLPVTGLKLDRTFVADLPQDPGSDRIAAAVARLAGDFGLTSTCEGVETADQARHLAAQGWQTAQGFHFGVPGPEERWFPAGAQGA